MSKLTVDLVRDAIAGSRSAFGEIVAELTPVIHARVARLLVRYRGDATRDPRREVRDFVQQVFVALFEDDARVFRQWDPERGRSLTSFVSLVAEREVIPPVEALAQREREEEDGLADPRWDALPSGSLSAKDEAELEALAQQEGAPRAAYEAFLPMTDDEREALAERAFSEITRRKAGIAAAAETAAPAPAAPVTSKTKGALVIPSPARKRALYALTATAALAAAASFALLYRPAPAPIAGYVAFVEEGRSQERPYVLPGDVPSTEPVRLQGDARVHVTLRPETTVQGPVVARSFLVVNGVARTWDVPVEVGPNGTLRVAGLRRATFSAAADGACDLVFVVGRPDALPSNAALGARIEAHDRVAARQGFQIVAVPLRLGPP